MADSPDARGKFALRIVIILLLLFLGWRVFTLGMADAKALKAPEEALQWRRSHPAALLIL